MLMSNVEFQSTIATMQASSSFGLLSLLRVLA